MSPARSRSTCLGGWSTVEVAKGFDHRPVRLSLAVEPGVRDLEVPLERAIDLRPAGWRTSDSHVHFLAPSTALLQAAAEDVAFVHLLATQLGDHFINVPDLTWGSQWDPSHRHAVFVGTENRQNVLGHLALLGARRPVLPLASGGAPEGRIGQEVRELLLDWAEQCHVAGGLVVGAHFPLPYAEIAADIVAGAIDAVEMQMLRAGPRQPVDPRVVPVPELWLPPAGAGRHGQDVGRGAGRRSPHVCPPRSGRRAELRVLVGSRPGRPDVRDVRVRSSSCWSRVASRAA